MTNEHKLSETRSTARLDAMTKRFESGFFVDVHTGEQLPEGACDANGVDPVGEDDEGFWWGTERAAWVLSHQHFTVEIWGMLGAVPWQGVFVGTEEEAVDYAERRRVDVTGTCSGDVNSAVPAWEVAGRPSPKRPDV